MRFPCPAAKRTTAHVGPEIFFIVLKGLRERMGREQAEGGVRKMMLPNLLVDQT